MLLGDIVIKFEEPWFGIAEHGFAKVITGNSVNDIEAIRLIEFYSARHVVDHHRTSHAVVRSTFETGSSESHFHG